MRLTASKAPQGGPAQDRSHRDIQDAIKRLEKKLADLTSAGAGGSITSISTSPPITGGPITTTGTIGVNEFDTSSSGVVPASGGGTANFLRADGAWAAPSAGVPSTRLIDTTLPLTGGGDLSADRTLGVNTFGASASGVVPASGGGTTDFLRADGTWSPVVVPAAIGNFIFGSGIDGTLTFDGASTVTLHDGTTIAPTASVYKLPCDVVAATMTVNAGVRIQVNGFRIFVSGTLANNGQIDDNGVPGLNNGSGGGNPRTSEFYNAPATGTGAGTVGNSASNVPRSYAKTLTAAAGGTAPSHNGSNGGPFQGGGGGSGGTSGGNGGASGSVTVSSATQGSPSLLSFYFGFLDGSPTSRWNWNAAAGGGGSGSAGSFSYAGGAGSGGGIVFVAARVLAGSGTFQAIGGAGGSSQVPPVNSTGYGAGGGGAGGWVILTYATAAGGTWTASAAGGTGGTGADGFGTGAGSKGGNGGNGGDGIVIKFNLSGDGT